MSRGTDKKTTLRVGLVQQAVANNDKQLSWQRSKEQITALAEQGCELVMLQ
ncbi:MAG: acyltransferase, partial [Paraglaciecola sp.]|nr:acyltransferase [Paraglaciecola sp.]